MNAVAAIARPIEPATDIARLRGFVTAFADLLAATRDEGAILESGRALLSRLIAKDDWLPEEFTRPHPDRYQQYLLHCDSRERFSIVSFVWGPGQATPIHDHTVWGLVGVLRGAERVERFRQSPDGRLIPHGEQLLHAGEVDAVSPRIGDIHRVTNGLADRPSISIHVYGANIGAVERATYAPDGTPKTFISGYANGVIPNLWDRSRNA
ncbi:cysteine dioxygenase [Sphingobium chlorophenolicum]|uniref:Cysteine dioxygenase type I n=1 Tax=Sphingobium chlorophenolicum TaxID=46429 RepID=A0A081R9T0_SPHCR|nr:cysteine dioxygenase [Sphingobium chlorophenolicum]KEQ51953.1 Cysteine dioxygenase type I [Sphingobium chlorophenolicum]